MKWKLFSVLLFFLSGCAEQSSVVEVSSSDPNVPAYRFIGEAANRFSEVISRNAQTAQGRQNEILDELKQYAGWFMLAFVGGLIFWGFTRSRYGWVIPAASVGGLVLIYFFSSLGQYVPYVVVALAISLLLWKAIEYQEERNAKGEQK